MPPKVLLLLAILCFVRGAGAGDALPFTYVNGFILVQAQVAGHAESLTMLVDSGASAGVLDLGTARRLRLPFGAAETVQGVGSEAEAYRLEDARISANGRTIARAALAIDLSMAVPLCGRPVDGLLGMDFFEGRVVQIDYAAKKLRFLESAPAAGTRLPLRCINDVFCAAVSVNGSKPRWTRLDTGCNDALHWVVPRSAASGRRGTTIGFIDERRDLTRAAVRLGDLELARVETSLHGRPLFPGEAGLLGNGLLSRYLVTIDGPGRTLWLE